MSKKLTIINAKFTKDYGIPGALVYDPDAYIAPIGVEFTLGDDAVEWQNEKAVKHCKMLVLPKGTKWFEGDRAQIVAYFDDEFQLYGKGYKHASRFNRVAAHLDPEVTKFIAKWFENDPEGECAGFWRVRRNQKGELVLRFWRKDTQISDDFIEAAREAVRN